MESNAPTLTGIDPAHLGGVKQLAMAMQHRGSDKGAPVRSTLILLGDRWSTLIILVLGIGIWRHAQLRRVLGYLGAEGGISQRVLTQKLRVLEREGYVFRNATDSVPPKVSYGLTTLGTALHARIRDLIGWIDSQDEAIHAARTAFDRDYTEAHDHP